MVLKIVPHSSLVRNGDSVKVSLFRVEGKIGRNIMNTIRKVFLEMEVGFISSKCGINLMKARQLSVH
jgi:hypothetical protein